MIAEAKLDDRPEIVHRLKRSEWPSANKICDLAEIAVEALRPETPNYFRSLFGETASWLPPYRRFSEYNILNPWRPLTMARFLLDLTMPASASATPDWARMLFPPLVNRRLWRPTEFFRKSDEYGGVSSFPTEHWFFINGIATNQHVARLNAAYLAHLFHRPVTVIQNATNSVLVDLYECAIGKGFKTDPNSQDRKTMTEPAWCATAATLEAMNEDHTEKVVIIAHSQGTIIAANVLRAVAKAMGSGLIHQENPRWHPFVNRLMGGIRTEAEKITREKVAHGFSEFGAGGARKALERLAKLEIYTFANCADKMRFVFPANQVPYMEHFANEHDLVSRLGILSPFRDGPGSLIEIDGTAYKQERAWGHLLNEHYLAPIDDYLYPEESGKPYPDNPFTGGGKRSLQPRLYGYFHGKRPSPTVNAHD